MTYRQKLLANTATVNNPNVTVSSTGTITSAMTESAPPTYLVGRWRQASNQSTSNNGDTLTNMTAEVNQLSGIITHSGTNFTVTGTHTFIVCLAVECTFTSSNDIICLITLDGADIGQERWGTTSSGAYRKSCSLVHTFTATNGQVLTFQVWTVAGSSLAHVILTRTNVTIVALN